MNAPFSLRAMKTLAFEKVPHAQQAFASMKESRVIFDLSTMLASRNHRPRLDKGVTVQERADQPGDQRLSS
jgi:hypothetical protein